MKYNEEKKTIFSGGFNFFFGEEFFYWTLNFKDEKKVICMNDNMIKNLLLRNLKVYFIKKLSKWW